jgi:hypothetical protein
MTGAERVLRSALALPRLPERAAPCRNCVAANTQALRHDTGTLTKFIDLMAYRTSELWKILEACKRGSGRLL